MADAIIESPISVSMVTSDDRDAPRLTLRASNVQQLQSQLQELENSGALVDVGRVAALFQIKARLGAQLGATPLDPDADGGSFNNVQAAPTVAPLPAATQPPPAAPAKFPAFGGFKAPAVAAAPPAASAASAPRPAAEPPAAAPAANGFPAAPAWKRP